MNLGVKMTTQLEELEITKITYDSYYNYQNFSSDEPTARINRTPFYVKYEEGVPAFYFRYQHTFKEISIEAFLTNCEQSRMFDMSNWRQQVEAYFNQSIEEIQCQIEEQRKMKKSSTIN
tara:strand:+ start:62 stop:418 length:357 start_codon:yes stop_codon:yes gene_type:complete